MRAPSQRRALGVLFSALVLFFGGITWAAASAGVWVVAIAAAVIGLWLATMAFAALRPPRRVQ